MTRLAKIIVVEIKLFFRDPASWVVALLLPSFVLLILGALPSLRTPQEIFGGQRFIDLFVPSLVVITLATLGLNSIPIRLATQRENGVLRRLSTTPIHPAKLLATQLGINMTAAVVAVALLMLVGKVVFAIPFPQHASGFLATFILGMSSLFAVGLLVAAVAPTARASAAFSLPMYFLVMFLGGVYLPRVFLPDFLVRIGVYTPPGVQALLDSWTGVTPQPLQLAVMGAITVAAGLAAARFFRWE